MTFSLIAFHLQKRRDRSARSRPGFLLRVSDGTARSLPWFLKIVGQARPCLFFLSPSASRLFFAPLVFPVWNQGLELLYGYDILGGMGMERKILCLKAVLSAVVPPEKRGTDLWHF